MLSFYLEPADIALVVTDFLRTAKISGSKVNADDMELRTLTEPMQAEIEKISSAFYSFTPEQKKDRAFMEVYYQQYYEVSEKMYAVQLAFAQSHPNSFISIGALMPLAKNDKFVDDAASTFQELDPKLKETAAGKAVAYALDTGQKTKIGLRAIPFVQNDENGKPVSLESFKGKYVLIDFWASWCIPCRQENPNVVAAYHKFKDRGFTVLGVSLDRPGAHDAWVKAIADDKLDWTHVSDLKFWDNEVALAYGVRSVPSNFLIDPSGKIIAKNLRGDALDYKLSDLFNAESKSK